MTSTARTVLIVVAALGVGFYLGWNGSRQSAAPTAPLTPELGQPPNWRLSVGAGVRVQVPALSDSPLPLDFGK